MKHLHRKNDIAHAVAFVQMHPALHAGNGNVSEGADNQIAGMTFRAGLGKVRNIGVRNRDGAGQLIGEGTQAGAEHEPDLALSVGCHKS